ncbi:unnamed protein product [Cochlearia groenlandica]
MLKEEEISVIGSCLGKGGFLLAHLAALSPAWMVHLTFSASFCLGIGGFRLAPLTAFVSIVCGSLDINGWL